MRSFDAGELTGRTAERGMDPRDRRRQRAGLLGRGAVNRGSARLATHVSHV